MTWGRDYSNAERRAYGKGLHRGRALEREEHSATHGHEDEGDIIAWLERYYQEGYKARSRGQFTQSPYKRATVRDYMWQKGYRNRDLAASAEFAHKQALPPPRVFDSMSVGFTGFGFDNALDLKGRDFGELRRELERNPWRDGEASRIIAGCRVFRTPEDYMENKE